MTSPSESEPVEPPVKPSTRLSARRRWLFRGVVLLILALGQELLFRGLFPTPEVARFNRIHYQQMAQSHPGFAGVMERGLVYDRLLLESRPDGFSEVHNLNMYGFRGADFRIEPTPGRRRILVVGDSVVEGQGVGDGENITAEWSRLLARDSVPAEVINLGVIAANLTHLWILTRDAVELLRPDDVVVAIYANDLPAPDDATLKHTRAERFPRNEPDSSLPRAVDLIGRAIVEKPIYRRWPHLPVRLFAPVPDESNPWHNDRPRPPGLKESLFEDMKAGRLNPWLYFQTQDIPGLLAHDFAAGGSPRPFLEAVAGICRSAGVGLTVVYTPFCGVVDRRYAPALVEEGMDRETAEALSVDPKYRNQNRVVAEACRELGIPLADPTPDLEAVEAAGTPAYWPYDTHPNALGYATIARRIHEVWKASRAEASKPPSQPGASS